MLLSIDVDYMLACNVYGVVKGRKTDTSNFGMTSALVESVVVPPVRLSNTAHIYYVASILTMRSALELLANRPLSRLI